MSTTKKYSLQADRVIASIRHSFIFSSVERMISPSVRTFSITLLFYLSLYFSTSNRTFILLSCLLLVGLFLQLKNFSLSLLLVLTATLTFAKGKSVEFLLLPKELVPQNKLFDISYYFTLYGADIFLVLLLFLYFRQKLDTTVKAKIRAVVLHPDILYPAWIFLLFIGVTLLPSIGNHYPEVILLSAVQLARMLILFCLPQLFPLSKNQRQQLYLVITASVIFESAWTVLQHFTGGNLGRDIEANLPGLLFEYGTSTETRSVLRASGTFFEASILGTFLLMNMTLLSHALFEEREQSRLVKQLYGIGIIAGGVGIIYTGSRGVYLLMMALIGTLLYFKRKTVSTWFRKMPYKKELLLLVFIASLPIATFLAVRSGSLTDLFTATGSGTYRIQIAQYALRLGMINPFGVGLNLSPYYFATAFPQENYIFDPAHPHNIIFQVFAETGFIGTLVFLVFIYFYVRPFLKKQRKINGFFLASIVYLLCAQFYPIFISQPEILSLFFLFAGFALVPARPVMRDSAAAAPNNV